MIDSLRQNEFGMHCSAFFVLQEMVCAAVAISGVSALCARCDPDSRVAVVKQPVVTATCSGLTAYVNEGDYQRGCQSCLQTDFSLQWTSPEGHFEIPEEHFEIQFEYFLTY